KHFIFIFTADNDKEMSYTRASFGCITFFFLLFTGFVGYCGPGDNVGDTPPKRELRGAWIATVVNIDWPSASNLTTAEQKAELIRHLDNHQRAGINAIFLQIRPTADAFYAK